MSRHNGVPVKLFFYKIRWKARFGVLLVYKDKTEHDLKNTQKINWKDVHKNWKMPLRKRDE